MTPSSPPPHQRAASHSPDTWFYCFLIFFCYYFKRVCAFCGVFFFFSARLPLGGLVRDVGVLRLAERRGGAGGAPGCAGSRRGAGDGGPVGGCRGPSYPPPPTHTPRNCPFPKSFALSSVFRGHDIAGCVGKSHLRFESSLRRVSACCSARRGVG